MRALSREEQALFDEMKEKCLSKGQYKDEKAKDKFKMLCHLEDFEIQYWELQKENEILKQNAENNDKVVDKINWENQLLKKENKQLKDSWNKLKEYINENLYFYSGLQGEDLETDFSMQLILDKMQELEQGSDSND